MRALGALCAALWVVFLVVSALPEVEAFLVDECADAKHGAGGAALDVVEVALEEADVDVLRTVRVVDPGRDVMEIPRCQRSDVVRQVVSKSPVTKALDPSQPAKKS